MVALTFDDGPSSTTSEVLDVLEQYDVKLFRPPYLAISNSMYENVDLAFIQENTNTVQAFFIQAITIDRCKAGVQ